MREGREKYTCLSLPEFPRKTSPITLTVCIWFLFRGIISILSLNSLVQCHKCVFVNWFWTYAAAPVFTCLYETDLILLLDLNTSGLVLHISDQRPTYMTLPTNRTAPWSLIISDTLWISVTTVHIYSVHLLNKACQPQSRHFLLTDRWSWGARPCSISASPVRS